MKKFFCVTSLFFAWAMPVFADGSSLSPAELSEANSREQLDQLASALLVSPQYADFVEAFTKRMDGRDFRISRIKAISLGERSFVSMSLRSKDSKGAWQEDDTEIFAEMISRSPGESKVFAISYKFSKVSPVYISAEGTGVAVPESVGSLLLTQEFTNVLADLVGKAKRQGRDPMVSHFSSEVEGGKDIAQVWLADRSEDDPFAPERKAGHIEAKASTDVLGKTAFEAVSYLPTGG